jgi:hypothetical protein
LSPQQDSPAALTGCDAGGPQAVNAKRGAALPRYFLPIVDGDHRQPDAEGIDLPGDQAAFDHVISLREMRKTRLNPAAYSIDVMNEQGVLIFTVPIDLPSIQAE